MHHAEGVNLADLVKFDISTRDIIHKRESVKVWEAINQLGNQVVNMPDNSMKEKIKVILTPFIEEHIETEVEGFNTKITKRMTLYI